MFNSHNNDDLCGEKGESLDMQWLNIGSKSVQGIVQEEYSYANAITQMKQCKNTPNVNSG